MMKLDWHESAEYPGLHEATMPPWEVMPGTVLRGLRIWIQARPHYCDRGRFHAQTDAPLDSAEGWPRYYFDLDVAKREIAAWLNCRKEVKP